MGRDADVVIEHAVAVMTIADAPQERREIVERQREELEHHLWPGMFRVFVDEDREGPGPTARRAWRWASTQGRRGCTVLQDDAVPCADVAYGIERAMSLAPGRPISHMEWTKKSEEARRRGLNWIETRGNAMGVAITMPSHLAFAVCKNADRLFGEAWPKDDDSVLAAAMQAMGVRPVHLVPTLFQHGCPSSSVMGHGGSGRVNRWSLAPDGSAYDVRFQPLREDNFIKSSATLAPKAWIDEHRRA